MIFFHLQSLWFWDNNKKLLTASVETQQLKNGN
jgi:hypothetical protein